MSRITPKQQRFVTEYLVDLNATQAAIRAGYNPKTAQQQGSRLLAHVVVKQAIAAAGMMASGLRRLTRSFMVHDNQAGS